MSNNSRGVLIFAINSKIDYIKLAEVAAKQAKEFLQLPVTLVTNELIESNKYFDSVIQIEDACSSVRNYKDENGQLSTVDWFNESRIRAYELSPYDKTLLIDADYFMFNDSLKVMFDTNVEFSCFDQTNDISGTLTSVTRLNAITIPMYWATVIYFTKCPFAEAIFTFMKIIKSNWDYYADLYMFKAKNFRNDFALSIALQALSGYSIYNANHLPGKLHTLFDESRVVRVDGNKVVCQSDTELTYVINTNVHCINKLDLSHFYAPT